MSEEISASKSIDNRGLARRCLAALALIFFTLTCACGCKSVEGIETPITQVSPSPSIIVPTSTSSPSPTSTPVTVTATASHLQPYCDSQVGDWVEKEHTVRCYSYFNPDVRDAIRLDILSQINAAYLDLETGNTNESSADIYFILLCGSQCFPGWRSMEGVIVAFHFEDTKINMPAIKPTFEECAEILQESIGSRSLPGGSFPPFRYYACVLTKEGRVGWIRNDTVYRLAHAGGDEGKITYWIWDRFITD